VALYSSADEHERDLARLACRRAFKEFRRALLDEEHPDDELVARVAGAAQSPRGA
jgi:hypothetical protein